MPLAPSRLARLALAAALALPCLAAAQYDPSRAPPPPRRAPPPQARAQGPGDTGLTLAARLGVGVPGGAISDEGDPRLGDIVDTKIPFWLELGFRFSPTVWGGFFLELAPVSVDDSFCLAGRGCSGASARFGVDVQLHLRPHHAVDPWIGVGVAAEFISIEAYDPTVDDLSEFSFGGLELPVVEAGVDLAVTPRFTLGPYVSWSAGQYTSYRVETPGLEDVSGRIRDRATHTWLQLGLKATFKL